MNQINQYYQVLGLQPNASPDEIKQAYRKLAKLWHPDRFYDNPSQKQKAETQFKIIVKAYEILKEHNNQNTNGENRSQFYSKKSSPDFYYQQGIIYAESEQYEEAITEFSRAIHLDDKYIKAYQYRGFVLSKLGYENRADADFRKVQEIKIENTYQQSYTSNRDTTSDQRHKRKKSPQTSKSNYQQNTKFDFNLCSTWQSNWVFRGISLPVNLVSISDNSHFLASVSKSKMIKLWNLTTGGEIALLSQHKSLVTSLSFTPDNRFLISGSEDKNLIIWDLQNYTSKILGTWTNRHNQAILSLNISCDSKILVSGSADKSVKVWEIYSTADPYTLTGYKSEILAVAISPNQDFFVAGGLDKDIKIRQINNGKIIQSITVDSGITSVVFSQDSQLLATGGFDGTIQLWYWKTGEKFVQIEGHSKPINHLRFSPDGEEIMSGSLDKTLKIWQLDISQKNVRLKENYSEILSFDRSADGKTLVCGYCDNSIRIFEFKY